MESWVRDDVLSLANLGSLREIEQFWSQVAWHSLLATHTRAHNLTGEGKKSILTLERWLYPEDEQKCLEDAWSHSQNWALNCQVCIYCGLLGEEAGTRERHSVVYFSFFTVFSQLASLLKVLIKSEETYSSLRKILKIMRTNEPFSFGIGSKTYSRRSVFSNVYINTSKAFSTTFGLNLCQLIGVFFHSVASGCLG